MRRMIASRSAVSGSIWVSSSKTGRAIFRRCAPMSRCERRLIATREARQLGIGDDIGAVTVVTAVGNGDTDLVESSRPDEDLTVFEILERPSLLELFESREGGALDAIGLGNVDPILLFEPLDRLLARILVSDAPNEVIEDSLSQRPRRGLHGVDLEPLDHRARDSHSTREYRRPLRAKAGQG